MPVQTLKNCRGQVQSRYFTLIRIIFNSEKALMGEGCIIVSPIGQVCNS